jgi:hypothetical protein
MCARQPACVVHTHLSRARCTSRARVDDWPALPHTSPLDAASVRALLGGHVQNQTLVLVGDSITEGIWDWLICESHREGLRSIRLDDTERGTGRGLIDVHVQSLREPRFRDAVRRFWDGWFGEAWGPDGPPLAMDVRAFAFPETRSHLVLRKIARFQRQDAAALLRLGDVFVFNFGLHYDVESSEAVQHFEASMREMAQLFAQSEKTVLYRETAAQHFRGTGSFTSWAQAHLGESACGCEPTPAAAEATNKLRRMNDVVRRELESQAPRVRVLSFYDFTALLHYAHEEDYCAHETPLKRQQGCCDCSHFCYTPQLAGHVIAAMVEGFANASH